ncbi:MAG: hypothetical protein K2O45_03920, partial [Oscillospiraceae bacterium]|nr:hypothetical protein [Oscillospiraceae bacterium]
MATPTRFPYDKISRKAKFGTVAESCSEKVAASFVWASVNTFSATSGHFAKAAETFFPLIPTKPKKTKMDAKNRKPFLDFLSWCAVPCSGGYSVSI